MTDVFNDLFIFEMANNHSGSADHGLKIIDAMAKIARKHDINAGVKLQYRNLDTFIHPDHQENSEHKHVQRFLGTRLSDAEMMSLVSATRDQGLVSVVTPFDEPSVDKCLDHGVQVLKVASCSATDWPLLGAIAETNKPVIVSTGGLTMYDIDNIVSFFGHKNVEFALLHCVGIYPTPRDALQLGFIEKMRKRYPYIPVGYSGHEDPDDLDVVKIAISKGAAILERHVGVPVQDVQLNAYSMGPDQTDRWVESALSAREMIGSRKDKRIRQEELDSLLSLKRGVFAYRDIEKGAVLGPEDVFYAMPCEEGQSTSGEFGEYRTSFVASRDYRKGEPIFEHASPDPISLVRGVIHDAKGMLYEAGIHLGSNIQIELSHHFGMEQFRRVGALIVNVMNREYCKKLIVVLPGQKHPRHHHKSKEETFQLLWGDLTAELDGSQSTLRPGDSVLVERGVWHSFSSRDGAIFEEVSTTHLKDDSFYEDERIASLDPIERKTIVESW